MKTGASRLLIRVILGMLFAGPAHAQTGITYRFREDTLVGRAWVLGDDARREIEAGEGGTAAGRVEMWKDGGKQIFVRDSSDRRSSFEIPPGYRFQEPVITPPARR